MHLRTLLSALALLGLIIALPTDVQAKQYRFLGPHPAGSGQGGAYCHIEFPHVHAYAPYKAKILFRKHHEGYYFVGDPVAHGYDGESYSYHGAHPIHVNEVVVSVEAETPAIEWCYIQGPHFHAHPPSANASFEVKGDVHWYVGTYPPEFEVQRKSAVRINAVYEPIEYKRPVVVVEPPRAYVDVFVSAPVVPVPVVPVPIAPVPVVAPVPGPPIPVPGIGFAAGGVVGPPHVHGHGHGHIKGPYKHKGHYNPKHKGKPKHKYKGKHKSKGKHKR